ncbi:MAG: DUF3883 domain-containing protein, partial [Anaerolineaceae bacterium]|nr:DUF3883 domain-containing protein [Anaerolineaceae bacterium]
SQKLLVKPEMMFFEDRPGWGEKFKVVKNNLTPRIEGVWLGMEAAGVRSLSDVINTELITCENMNDDQSLLNIILERRNLIQRVIEEHRNQGVKNINILSLDNLTFYLADKIEIERIFHGFGKQEVSELESVDAILHKGSLYFTTPDGNYPWKGIARELSFVVNSTGELRSLAMELKEILSQSFDEAIKTLNELGYPMIEVSETNISDGITLEYEDEEELESLRIGIDFPEGGRQKTKNSSELKPSDNLGVENKKQLIDKADNKKRKTSRLRSYVYPDEAYTTKQEDPSFSERRNKVAAQGVEHVMKFEREEGRVPKDMETIQTHHPGYDIESTNGNGEIRYIEVKSLSGFWDSQNPAELTKTEFETAKKKGEDYWLYIVERVNSDDFQIHEVQNPANRVDYYLFDAGWIVRNI